MVNSAGECSPLWVHAIKPRCHKPRAISDTQSPVHCAHSRSHTHRHTRTHAQTRVYTPHVHTHTCTHTCNAHMHRLVCAHSRVHAHTCTLTLTLACSRGHVKMRPRRWATCRATCPPTPGGGRPRAALRPRKPVGPGRRPCKACGSRPGLQPPGETLQLVAPGNSYP